jgi:hypothetical protein
VPRFVDRELRAFLRCGILAHGFVRALRRLRSRPRGRVRWVPGALPARAGRFPGAPFRTGRAPFVMHPALRDGS